MHPGQKLAAQQLAEYAAMRRRGKAAAGEKARHEMPKSEPQKPLNPKSREPDTQTLNP